MTDGEALLAAIIAHPEEDAPRLIYADWLEENGQGERAEFIRVQVELARIANSAPCCTAPANRHEVGCARRTAKKRRAFSDKGRCRRCDYLSALAGRDKRRRRLVARERQLLERSAKAGPKFAADINYWLHGEPTDPRARPIAPVGTFVRGFIERVTCTAADWLSHGDAIRAAHPVTCVRLTTELGPHVTYSSYDLDNRLLTIRFTARLKSVTWGPEQAEVAAYLKLLQAEWPGVTFELPPSNPWRDNIGPLVRSGLTSHATAAAAAGLTPPDPAA